jgi:hypothetical protein
MFREPRRRLSQNPGRVIIADYQLNGGIRPVGRLSLELRTRFGDQIDDRNARSVLFVNCSEDSVGNQLNDLTQLDRPVLFKLGYAMCL